MFEWVGARFRSGSAQGRDRYIKAGRTLGTGLIQRMLTMGIGVVVAPACLRYLGAERYGLWMTLTSTLAVLGSSDLGIGNGLLNEIARADGLRDREVAKRAVSTAFLMLGSIGLLLLLVVIGLHDVAPWERWLNLRNPSMRPECETVALIVGASIALGLPMGVAGRISSGYQEGALANLWQMVGAIAGAICVIAGVALRQSMPVLVLATVGGAFLGNLGLMVHELGFRRTWLRPSFSLWKNGVAKVLLRDGVLIVAAQVGTSLLAGAVPLVLAHKTTYSVVAEFTFLQKILGAAAAVGMVASAPFWPAYAEALTRKDLKWVRQALNANLIVSLLGAAVPIAVILPLCPWAFSVFGVRWEETGWGLVLAAGLLQVVVALRSSVAVAVGGAGRFLQASLIVGAFALISYAPLLVHWAGAAGAPLWMCFCEGCIGTLFWRQMQVVLRSDGSGKET